MTGLACKACLVSRFTLKLDQPQCGISWQVPNKINVFTCVLTAFTAQQTE